MASYPPLMSRRRRRREERKTTPTPRSSGSGPSTVQKVVALLFGLLLVTSMFMGILYAFS